MLKFIRKNDEYNTLNKRILEAETDIIKLKTRLDTLALTNDDMLNKVLRKIQTRKPVLEDEKEKDIYNGVLIRGT